jgi:hypothetical protein
MALTASLPAKNCFGGAPIAASCTNTVPSFVELHERESVTRRLADSRAQLLEVTCGGGDAVPRLQSGLDDRCSDATAGAGDKPNLAHAREDTLRAAAY